ncbi:hypothetical protein G5C51_32340 [Streptomyces sp. A7024]|uniref:Uncharacterized protein n=1 Tax=Streptomyces coryli TaxID=1128680 RepID=A0A6G4U8X2_9ACTN|nr:hypothetical protein [Streptomyces coryli]NGN68573.1 hypothetical protein [Streptomyces coryli]
MTNRAKFLAISAATAVSASLLMGSSASGSEADELQKQINEALARTEGAQQISSYEIAWDEGRAILAFPRPGEVEAAPSSVAAVRLMAKSAGVKESDIDPTGETYGVAALSDESGDEIPADEQGDQTSVDPMKADTCPTQAFGDDWYCFYQKKYFEGRRLQWQGRYDDKKVYFEKYDFRNRTSGYSNKSGKKIYTYDYERASPGVPNVYTCTNHLWTEDPHERSSSLPAYLDDAADCFKTN